VPSWYLQKNQKGVTIMCGYKRLYLSAVLSLFFVLACSSVPPAQTALTTLQGKQGGTIVYGLVSGATTPAMAMARILHNVQNNCGDKPQVGRVFRVRGSNSDAVFFTVTNHAGGNVPVAGMLIASQTGPKAAEAAMVSDAAARFGSTMNPLLSQLFGVWHPGAAVAAAGKASAGGGGALPPMHTVSLADGTARVNLPDGWNLGPGSKGGTAVVMGPQGEAIDLNWYLLVQDPRAPDYQRQMRMGIKPLPSIHIICPYNPNLTTAFPDIYQRMQTAAGLGTAPPKVDTIKPVEGTQGQCVDATGQVNLGGKGMKEFRELMCGTPPFQNGVYEYKISFYWLPAGATNRQRAICDAIMANYRVDQQRVDAQAAPYIQMLQQHTQALMALTQQQIAHSQQMTNDTLARARQADAEHDAQHAQWRQGEDNISRQGQGFSNYILDQTVVQDNNMYGNRTIGHGTLWNSEADALVKANPNRFEYVPTQNYWRGTDYVP
jgi:hypothetical protein